MKIRDYIQDNLVSYCQFYQTTEIISPSIEQVLMLRELCQQEIEKHFKERAK